jgi:hypothetical protein
MSGIDELRTLLREVDTELLDVEQKLKIKESGIQEKQTVENRKSIKGKEHSVRIFREQMASSERKAEREKFELRVRIELLEKKIRDIDEHYEHLVQNHYTPSINALLEKPVEMKLPIAIHELTARKKQLQSKKETLTLTIKNTEELEQIQLKEKYEAEKQRIFGEVQSLKQQTKKPVKQVKHVSLKLSEETIPKEDDFSRFKREEFLRASEVWYKKQRQIICGEIPLPSKYDPYWTSEAQACMEPGEYASYAPHGGLYTYTSMRLKDASEV